MIGSLLDAELQKNLENSSQSILFINRRGYHSFLTCRSCGGAITCPNCSVAMTYHKYGRGLSRIKNGGELVCHYCGFVREVPKICPSCSSEHMAFLGSGTQTLEENLEKNYPYAKVLRMDADTTTHKNSHEEILSSFRRGDADILIGTQMVTKGHDFPNVTLAGVVLADTSLYLNDYRANEKTFSLLTQVLGRAGRSEKEGRAVIQTYCPDNLTLSLAAKQDYDAFYEDEIKLRRASIFPPFCDIVTFLFSGKNEQAVKNAAEEFGKRLDFYAKCEFAGLRLIVFGPFEAAVYKLNGKYRLRYIIKCRFDKNSRVLFKKLFSEFSTGDENLSISADVNPSSL
jgi:primosomal protein N' (replication factor Y)